MPAYIMAFVDVSDPQRYEEYRKVVPGIIARFGGKYIVRAGKTQTLEGPEEKRRVVLVEFPTFEQAQAFYHSAEYTAAKKLRAVASTGTLVLVDGWTG